LTRGSIQGERIIGTINVTTVGHIRGGQTAYNTGIGFFLGYSTDAYKFSIGNPNGDYLLWDGSNLSSNKFILTGIGAFGGDGSDGALSISSGTTTLDVGAARVFIKNYTSISIIGTGKLAFSNPHSSGTIIILKSQGDVILTSSTVSLIDVSGMGAAGGANVNNAAGNPGTNGFNILKPTNKGLGGGGNNNTGGAGGTGETMELDLFPKIIKVSTGAGGGAGGDDTASASWVGGDGGAGGGGLIIECRGSLNFTGTIWSKGNNGGDGSDTVTDVSASGGGGGGAGGMVAVLYNTLTANTGTIDVTGGTGGAGGDRGASGSTYNGNGGGGGGGNTVAGGTGGDTTTGNGTATGGAGGAGGGKAAAGADGGDTTVAAGGGGGGGAGGDYYVLQNKYFA